METTPHDSVRIAATKEGAELREFCPGRSPACLSVIVPAHNESALLPRCLNSLLAQDTADVMRVIVIDNGSHDATADIARQWVPRFADAGHEMLVLQLPQGNKSAALNAGDAAAVGACRIYLDADVELSPGCVSKVAAAMSDGTGIEMCSPRMCIAPARAWVTRRYARVWTALPWVNDDVIGGGFYAVSAAGRRRWKHFPDVLAEDVFVQAQFRKHERRVLRSEHFLVRLPDGWTDLLRLRTRWLSGNRQIARQVQGEWGRAACPLRQRLLILLRSPSLWPDLPLYFLLNATAFWRARRREALGTSIWERCRPKLESAAEDDAELAPIGPTN
ncbi:MAG TPA: glycosyltransferase family 2 protein [Tepidisphaeraceae bacterium]